MSTENTGAIFSDCGKYRYVLWRKWNDNPMAAFIGLNPSTANANKNDNTITKIIKVAYNNGYGGFYMLNLFGLVTPYPKDLLTCSDPVGENDKYLWEYISKSASVVCCWGNFKEAQERVKSVTNILPISLLAFAVNKNGTPKHPLYCKDDTRFVNYYKI